MWHVTDVCPLRCPYCFSRKTEEESPGDKAVRIAAILRQLGVQKVDIGGGEPLVYEYLPCAVAAVRANQMFCTITTSGVGRRSNIDFLKTEPSSFTRIILSLDAYAGNHDKLRGYNGAWASVNNLLESLDDSVRRKLVRINTVVTNSGEFTADLEMLADFVLSQEVREWCLIQPHPANKKPGFESFAVEENEFDAIVEKASKLMDSRTSLIKRKNSLYSDYWVLHPSGMLQKHSSGPDDCIGANINETGLETLISLVRASHASAPLE